MKSIELKGSTRTIAERSSEQTKALKALRKEGLVPCVMYGGEKNYNFTVLAKDLNKIIFTPHIYVIDLVIDGEKKNAILKDVQYHPVKDTAIHVDFYEIDETKPIVMNVPVDLVGLAPGVQAGGKLHHQMRRLKVRAFYTAIPEKLEISVTKLTLGKSLKVGELSFEGLELINPKDAVVCSVKTTRNTVDTDTATTEEAPAEGEAAAPEAAPAE